MPHHVTHHRIRLTHLNKKQQKLLVKRSVTAIAVIEPAMTLPQVYEIWINHEAAGVSSITWGLYVIAAIIWLLYGLQLKDRPIIISSSLWILTEIAVVIGTLMYS